MTRTGQAIMELGLTPEQKQQREQERIGRTSTMKTYKGLHAYIVYSFNNKPKVEEVIIVGEGIPEIFESTDKCRAVRIITENEKWDGRQLPRAEFIFETKREGMAFGGCFIYSSDSRFPSRHPIPLFNYDMTVEAYIW